MQQEDREGLGQGVPCQGGQRAGVLQQEDREDLGQVVPCQGGQRA